MSTPKYFQVTQTNGVTVIQLVNPSILERLLVNEIGDELVRYVEQEQPQKLVISFENVTHCSSEVIGGLIRVKKRVSANAGKMALCSMNHDIFRLFKITHLEGTVFQVYDDEKQAIAAIA